MPVASMPRAVIFDMDGLIFDTETLYQEALLQMAEELGIGAIDKAVVQATIGLSWEMTRDLLDRLLDGAFDPDELVVSWTTRYDALAEQRLALKPGVTELLMALERLSIPRAVATGSTRAVAHRHLDAHGLAGFFNAVITCEDCSRGKPAPDPFLLAARRLGVAPQSCWALEDSLNGVISAHDAGMMTIMVPDLVEPTEEARRRCLLVADSLFGVLDLLVNDGSEHR
jgi:HAD superfamily hydrolase (TIGR01509 family)